MKPIANINKSEICEEYLTTAIGIESLSLKYHVGKKKIREILKENKISFKKRGRQCSNTNKKVKDCSIKKFPLIEGKHYIAVDKLSGFTTNDYENKGGVLTSYIKKQYDIEIPSLYFRQKYYLETGLYWWEQWFDIRIEDNIETKKCPYCKWETIDTQNKSGVFETHLLKKHNITKNDYLKDFPQDREYFIGVNPSQNRQVETNKDKYVICQICGRKFARIDSHHLKTHAITKSEYIKQFGNTRLTSIEYHNHQSKITINTNTNAIFTKKSKAEKEIRDFIENRGIKCKTDRRILNGREIDIYIPEKKIGIEYNGNKWHTEWFGKKDRYYHVSKMETCEEQGIKLITIFEDEFILHKEIVLNKICHLLKLGTESKQKVYGRNCIIKIIGRQEAEGFLNKNHIQGFVCSSVYLGAYFKENLVGVMTFIKRQNNEWELTRFASDINCICCGIGGKLFKFFIKHYNFKEIKSFADRRWTIDYENNIYVKLGFSLDSFTKPNYTYYNNAVDRYKRFHKFNFRKERLIKRHAELDTNMSETEMVKKLGFDRIWDCGLIKYIYKNKDNSQ